MNTGQRRLADHIKRCSNSGDAVHQGIFNHWEGKLRGGIPSRGTAFRSWLRQAVFIVPSDVKHKSSESFADNHLHSFIEWLLWTHCRTGSDKLRKVYHSHLRVNQKELYTWQKINCELSCLISEKHKKLYARASCAHRVRQTLLSPLE
jgi:hypothetical protein